MFEKIEGSVGGLQKDTTEKPLHNIRRFPISWYTKPNRGFLRPTIVELG